MGAAASPRAQLPRWAVGTALPPPLLRFPPHPAPSLPLLPAPLLPACPSPHGGPRPSPLLPAPQVNFVNPDSLGSLPTFERVLAAPINRSRDRNASEADRELGASRSA